MTALAPTDHPISQGRALVCAIEPNGPFERALARLLMAAYKRRLRAIVKVAPVWVSETSYILSSPHFDTRGKGIL